MMQVNKKRRDAINRVSSFFYFKLTDLRSYNDHFLRGDKSIRLQLAYYNAMTEANLISRHLNDIHAFAEESGLCVQYLS